jgi:CheY-like chemotaxis protein
VDARQSAGDVGVKGRVLVADDEIQILRAFSRVLEHAGYEVTVASTGGEANKLVEDDRFDVLFADIAMPEMTGLELLRRARRVTPSLPVVLVTGSPAVETAMEAIEYNVYRYLVKPVEPNELVAIAEKATLLHRMLELRRDTRDVEDLAALSGSFESALARVWMAFQPIVRPDGAIFGYEALLRSDEPALPHPGAMLDAAERLGRLHDLGRVVRQRATSAFAKAEPSASLFVNVHTRDLLDD